jgi:CheY-like chemotaxis protein
MLPFFRLASVPNSESDAEKAEPIKILLADDHAAMRQSLRRLLDGEADIDVIAETDSLQSVMGHIRVRRPDVLVLDLGIPIPNRGSGIEALGRLDREARNMSIVVLTMNDDPAFARRAEPWGWCSRRWPTPTCRPPYAPPRAAGAM